MVKTRKRISPLVWWGLGFCSALAVGLVCLISMASSVYSEMPPLAQLKSIKSKDFQPYDVIAVLTGGRGRIRKALELFEQGYGRILYISGTDRQVHMKEILKELKWVGPVDESRIVLEKISENTIQNAEQLSGFMVEQGLKNVLLVTSPYHIRRATYIFRKTLPPDVRIDSYWFEMEPFDLSSWKRNSLGVWVTMSEFIKFFYAYLVLPGNR